MFVHSSVGPLFSMHMYQLIYKQVPIKNVHLSKEFMLKELLYRFKIGQLRRVFSVILRSNFNNVYEGGNGNGRDC